jgi:hypothetical protein
MALAFFRASTADDFEAGELDGVATGVDGALTLAGGGVEGTWTSPWIRPGFDLGDVVASWNAYTPPGSYLDVEIQGVSHVGFETGWYSLGRWVDDDDAGVRRSSRPGQADELGSVDVDIFRAGARLDAYRLRVTLARGRDGSGAPSVRLVAAIARSDGNFVLNQYKVVGAAQLDVPPFAQSPHAGEYPEYDGGGASWCSPASTAMVLGYWGAGPSDDELEWVDPQIADPAVVHAARYTYDAAYGGCGNWAFNTAYAGRFGLDAFVTRLRSLDDAAAFVRHGVPLVASIKARPGELDGFALPEGTAGHLVVITGVTDAGDAVVNDPAAPSNAEVPRVYDRVQFERAWLGGSGGIVYVIAPPETTLPPSPGNW